MLSVEAGGCSKVPIDEKQKRMREKKRGFFGVIEKLISFLKMNTNQCDVFAYIKVLVVM